MVKNITPVPNQDLRIMLLSTFRYSLGRMTYMPSFTKDLLFKYQHLFNERDWKRIIDEIEDTKHLGMSCDIHTWNEVKMFASGMILTLKEEENRWKHRNLKNK